MKRYKSLDGLRGIASVIVLIHHCIIIIPFFLKVHFHRISNDENNLLLQLSHIFWAGHEAVLLFFILSGFVLYNSVQKPQKYTLYIYNRFLRIYIPYVFAIIISASLYLTFYNFNLISHSNRFSEWFNSMWPFPIDYLSIISAIFMTSYNSHSINTVTWSLIHELRISLLIPILVWWMTKNNRFINLMVAISFLFVINVISTLIVPTSIGLYLYIMIMNLNDTFYYMIFFLIGIYLALNIEVIQKKLSEINSKVAFSLYVIGILFLLFEWIFPNISSLKYSENIYISKINFFLVDMLISIGIIIIFSLAISYTPMIKFLENKLFIFLGKISYSLYLIHPIVILCLIHTLGNNLNYILIIIFSFIISLLCGVFFYKIVEKRTFVLLRQD